MTERFNFCRFSLWLRITSARGKVHQSTSYHTSKDPSPHEIKRTRGLTCATCSWQMKGDHVRKGRLERLPVAQLKYLPGCIETYKDCTACLSLWGLVEHDPGVKTCQKHKIDQNRPKTSGQKPSGSNMTVRFNFCIFSLWLRITSARGKVHQSTSYHTSKDPSPHEIKRTRGLTCATCSWQMKGDHVRKGRLERLPVAQLKYLPGCIETYKDCTACLSLWGLVEHDPGVKTCQKHKIDQNRPKTSGQKPSGSNMTERFNFCGFSLWLRITSARGKVHQSTSYHTSKDPSPHEIKRTRGLTCATCSWQMKGDHVRKGRLERLPVAQLKYLPGCMQKISISQHQHHTIPNLQWNIVGIPKFTGIMKDLGAFK